MGTTRGRFSLLSSSTGETFSASLLIRGRGSPLLSCLSSLFAVAVVGLLICGSTPGLAQTGNVVVYPREIQDVLVNPGMGIETYDRFNGDPLYTGAEGDFDGPTTVLKPARSEPDFPDSSIAYCRWVWKTIEPEKGKIRWQIIDEAIDEAREDHQTLAIRLMPYDDERQLPKWYIESGARRANKPTDPDGSVWQPDFSDPLYYRYWGNLVRAFGKRYDGNPYLESVDISTVGYWGEGWSDYMPPIAVQKKLIDLYFRAFKRTPLVQNFGQPDGRALAYGVLKGAGWRADCWGDMGGLLGSGSALMLDFYPEQVVRLGIQGNWRRSPVALESCYVPGVWFQHKFDISYILQQALRWHASYVNIKSSPIPGPWKEQFERFEKRIGYRFLLRRLEYPREAKAGSMMPVEMWWQNDGVAPVYRDYILAIGLRSGNASAVIKTSADVRKWLPGDAVYNDTVYVPKHLTPGDYRVRIALLDPRTERPAIRLAIAGRQPDGWYDVGTIMVKSHPWPERY